MNTVRIFFGSAYMVPQNMYLIPQYGEGEGGGVYGSVLSQSNSKGTDSEPTISVADPHHLNMFVQIANVLKLSEIFLRGNGNLVFEPV
jgi:hypothetical protein